MSTIPWLRSVWWSAGIAETDPIFTASPAAGITAGDITNWNTAYGWGDHTGLYIPVGEKGAVNGVATLGPTGLVPNSQIPPLAITDTFVVASEAAMLALSTAETGDVAVRTDTNETYILKGTDPSVLGDWQLLNPVLPAESDPIFLASPAATILTGDITNWDAAFGWGDHALAGYLTSLPAHALTDHSDVTITASGKGDILVYDSNVGQYVDLAPGANDTVLTADNTLDTGVKWAAAAAGASALDDLTDVTITGAAKGDLLVFDSVAGQWIDLTAGTDGWVLTADSTLDAGVKWAAPTGGGSAITVQDEGSTLTTAVTLFNFAGNAVVATEPVADQILVTISALTAVSDDPNPVLANDLNLGGYCIKAADQPTGDGDSVCLIGGDSLDSSGAGGGVIVQSGVGNGSLPSLTAAPAGAVPGGFVLADLQAPAYGYVGFGAPTNVANAGTGNGVSTIWTLPEGDGALGQVMVTDGSGTLSWATPVATESDPVFLASPAGGITNTDINNWDSWLTSPANGITAGQITNWNTAYSWGDHALVGYLTSVPAGYVRTPMIEDLDVATWDIRGSDSSTTAVDGGDATVRGGNGTGAGANGGDLFLLGGEGGQDGGDAILQGGEGDCAAGVPGLAWVRGWIEDSTVITCVAGEALVSGGDNTGQGFAGDATFRGGNATVNRPGARAVIQGGSSLDCSDHAGGVWIYDGQGDGSLPAIPAPTGTVAPMRVLFVDAQLTPGYVGLQAPSSVVAGTTGNGLNTIWTLPEGDGVGGQALVTDGAGNLSWAATTVGSAALHTLTAATAGNTIGNAANLQRWNWQLTANGQHGMFFGETADSTNGTGNQDIVHIETFSEASTADPIGIYQGGNLVFKVFGLTGTSRLNGGDVSGVPGDLEFNTLTATATDTDGGLWTVTLGGGSGVGNGGTGTFTAGDAAIVDVDAAAAGDGGDWLFLAGNAGDNNSDVDGTPGLSGGFQFITGAGGSLTAAANAQDATDGGVFEVELGVGGAVAGAGNAGADGHVRLKPATGSTSGARQEFRDAANLQGMSLKAPDSLNASGTFELAPKFLNVTTAAANIAVETEYVTVDPLTAGAPVVLTLHAATDERFRELVIKVISQDPVNTITLNSGTDTIDGAPNLVIPINSQWAVYRLINQPGTTNWYVV